MSPWMARINEPYDTWATAATNIQTAVDYATANIGSYDTVLVSSGTFYAPAEAGILVAAPLTIKSQQGREQTLVHGQGLTEAIFTISNAQAVVDGFTITNGSRRGVLMYGGTLQNCAIVSNSFSGGSSQGAGVWMTNGLVTNCFIAWNRTADQGGGAYLRGDARLVDSVIVSNYPKFDGGGVYVSQGAGVIISGCRITHNRARQGGTMGGGTYLNCLIAYNTNTPVIANAGAVFNATLVNCTVVKNYTINDNYPSGVSGCNLTNCIVAYNRGGDIVYSRSAYTCSPSKQPGEGNIAADPQFVDLDGGDFHLQFGSPAIDTGTNLAQITDDLDGNPRPQDGNNLGAFHDMGCYEAPAYTDGDLRCHFTVTPAAGWEAVTASCQAVLGGTSTNINYYWWDFGDGSPVQSGASMSTATHAFNQPGRYDITLTVSNTLGAVASHSLADAVVVGVATSYVAVGGTGSFPYASWEEAAGNIQDAVLAAEAAYDGGAPNPCVLVSNGVYGLIEPIAISKGVRVMGVAGRDETLVQRTASVNNLFNLYHPEAVLSGLTIAYGTNSGVYMESGIIENCAILSNRNPTAAGGGVYMDAGLIADSIISGNRAGNDANTGRGGGVYMVSGTISNSLVAVNEAGQNSDAGGGIYILSGEVIDSVISNNYTSARQAGGLYMKGGLLLRCHIVDNRAPGSSGGGLLAAEAVVLRNCLLANNVSRYAGSAIQGGGSTKRSTLINCTVASNRVNDLAVGRAAITDCFLTNCIAYFNVCGPSNIESNTYNCIASYTCTTAPDLAGTGNIAADPQFIDWENGDYRLSNNSPARRTGTTNGIIDTLDLAGGKRISGGQIDMGAYQSMPPAGTVYSFY